MSQWLPYLLLLACPVSMGLMMWLMMRMYPHRNMPAADPRVAELESQVAELRSELARRRDDRRAQRHAETDVGSSQEGESSACLSLLGGQQQGSRQRDGDTS